MNKKLLIKLVVVVLFLLGVVFYIKGHLYRAIPITGQVLDAETGQPIAGAVVTAIWMSQSPGFHSPNREIFELQEVLADEHGRYIINGWRWRFLPRPFGSIAADQPELTAYKFEYLPKEIKNGNPPWINHDFDIEWVGDVDIRLEPLTGTEIERIEKFEKTSYRPTSIYNDCSWKKRILRILEADKQMEFREKYFANLYKNNPDEPWASESLYEPWYLQDLGSNYVIACPEIIEILTKARESRNKE